MCRCPNVRERILCSWTLAILILLVAGCATAPVGVVRVDPREVQRDLTRTVLSSAEPSRMAMNVLQEHNLAELYDDDPEKAFAALHVHVTGDGVRGSALFALAELSFMHAERSKKSSYHLAAAIYASAFLFPEAPGAPPDPFDSSRARRRGSSRDAAACTRPRPPLRRYEVPPNTVAAERISISFNYSWF